MSRSYRKPYAVQGYGGLYKPLAKRWANKRVRKAKEVPDGKQYKKYYCSYDICDYKWLVTDDLDQYIKYLHK